MRAAMGKGEWRAEASTVCCKKHVASVLRYAMFEYLAVEAPSNITRSVSSGGVTLLGAPPMRQLFD